MKKFFAWALAYCFLFAWSQAATPANEIRVSSRDLGFPLVFVGARPYVDAPLQSARGVVPLFKVDITEAKNRAELVLKIVPDVKSGATSVVLDCHDAAGSTSEFSLQATGTLQKDGELPATAMNAEAEWFVAARYEEAGRGKFTIYVAGPPASLPYYIIVASAADRQWLSDRVQIAKVFPFFSWEKFMVPVYNQRP